MAGQGSCYIYLGEVKIRIADHINTSNQYGEPDFNIVDRQLSDTDVEIISQQIDYPKNCKQKAFSLHVNKTIQFLKKILPEKCYDNIVENDLYPNTYTKVIKVKEALAHLQKEGIFDRFPVRQETYSYEDFAGYL
jgi:hypothetical protein